MSSASAVNEISRSKQRYELQDRMLRGFAQLPNSTAKEICRHIGLQYEAYCDGPKRVGDLKKLGKVVVTGERECRVTKKKAEFYRIAEGARYCGGDKGLVSESTVQVVGAYDSKPADPEQAARRLSAMSAMLEEF